MEESYLIELNIFKDNAIYGLQKILLDNFPWNFYIEVPSWMLRACKKSR